ncbi:hypothetical protein BUALT_Bualt07G0095300 [Buddleja alternifolia]|uniref:Myb/SANT-like domain-containing protein n=1 Tax=Buddleja alternifolia TaxID=168488 RepID=A0AAV6XH89_9LAMI|nr:hypothetical protein BUALT_Bualt07G0095300 [Buddleja alternifolia]
MSYPSQAKMFYNGDWTYARVDFFISELEKIATYGNIQVKPRDHYAIIQARANLNEKFDIDFTFIKCNRRFQMLHQRYPMFQTIITTKGVYWDESNNHVYAPAPLWEMWIKESIIAEAYISIGEPQWEKLQKKFRPRIEPSPTPPKDLVILSSDDDDEGDNIELYPIMNVIEIEGDEEGEGSTKSNDVNQGNVPVIILDPTDKNSTNVPSPPYKFGPWCPSGVTPTKPPNVAKLVKPKKEPLDENSTTSKIMRKLKFP